MDRKDNLLGGALLLALLLACAPAASGAEWLRARADELELFSSADRARTAAAVEAIRSYRRALPHLLPPLEPASSFPTRVFLVRDREEYAKLRGNVGGAPQETAGYFLAAPEGGFVVVDYSDPGAGLATLLHELLHLEVERAMPGLPVWANEGLARAFSTFEVDGQTARVAHHHEGWAEPLEDDGPIPLGRLFSVDHSSLEYRGGELTRQFYAQSWALVRALLTGEEGRPGNFIEFCARIRDGRSAQEATIDHLPLEEAGLFARIRERHHGGRAEPLSVELEAVPGPPPGLEPAAPAEVEAGFAWMLRARGERFHRLARDRARAAMAADSASTRARLVHTLLVLDRQAQPRRLLEGLEALAGERPHDRDIRCSAGEAVLAAARAEPGGGGFALGEPHPLLVRAREHFAAVLERDGDDAWAMSGWARSHVDRWEIPDGVIDGLERAAHDFPRRIELALLACEYRGRRGEEELAWDAYRELVVPRRPGRKILQHARELIDRGLRTHDVARFNAAQDLIRAEELEAALAELDGLAASARDSTLREEAAGLATRLRPHAEAGP